MVVFYKTNRNLVYISKFYIQNASNFKIFPLVCSTEVSFTMGMSEFCVDTPMWKRVLEHLLWAYWQSKGSSCSEWIKYLKSLSFTMRDSVRQSGGHNAVMMTGISIWRFRTIAQ